MNNDLSIAESIIGYTFHDKGLLVRAFTHSSYANENALFDDYERLEFLGDAIVGYVVGAKLFSHFPSANEGFLTKRRAFLVKADTLGSIIDELDLIRFMKVGSNAEQSVLSSQNVKCDLFEAIVGAIYLDCNKDLSEAQKFILKHIENRLEDRDVDYKSQTLEYCAKNKIGYTLETEKVIDSANSFHFRAFLRVGNGFESEGEGHSKRVAEKNACKKFYDSLKK